MQNTETRRTMCCPLNGKICAEGRREDFARDEMSVPVQCRWWVHLYGKDPQSEKIIDQYDCAVAWLPVTTVETSQSSRFAAASVDKLADAVNETRKHVSMGLRSIVGGFNELAKRVDSGRQLRIESSGNENNGSLEHGESAGGL